MCRKRLEPFKCDFVPAGVIVLFMLKHRPLFNFLHAMHTEIIAETKGNFISKFKERYREFYRSIPVIEAKRLLKEEFNYLQSTISSGSLIYRCIRIYGKYLKGEKYNVL